MYKGEGMIIEKEREEDCVEDTDHIKIPVVKLFNTISRGGEGCMEIEHEGGEREDG